MKVRDALFKKLIASYQPSYTEDKWKRRVELYLECLSDATIVEDPLPVDIKTTVHKLDVIYTQLNNDIVNNSPKLLNLDSAFELQKKKYAIYAREGTLKGFAKATSDDTAKNMALTYISQEPYKKGQNKSYTLLELLDKAKAREMILNQLVYTVRNKKEMLVTNNAMLKLEASLDGDA